MNHILHDHETILPSISIRKILIVVVVYQVDKRYLGIDHQPVLYALPKDYNKQRI